MAHKILIVDDEKTNIALLKFILSSAKYEVVVAMDGKEGFEQVLKQQPDLIVCDVFMPNMNGYDFMCELKNLQGSIITPVIMLTSNETMQDIFTLEGVRGYFVKPIDPPQLIAKIVEILGPNKA